MGYKLQEQYTSKNQVAGAAANTVWNRGARKVSSITIHHWGNKGQQFDTVRDFLCTNNVPTSAHYVVQDGLVACIVSPDDCAFHAGNAEGNSHSIGIECRPEATDGDYATVAELIRDLRAIYGDIPLRPHNYWYNTACPGDYDLGRLDALARGNGTITVQSAIITPVTEEEDMALSDDDLRKVYEAVWFGAPGGRLIPNEAGGNGEWPYTTLGSMTARIGRDIVLPQIANLKNGQAVSPAQVADAVVAELGNDFAKVVVDELGKRIKQ